MDMKVITSVLSLAFTVSCFHIYPIDQDQPWSIVINKEEICDSEIQSLEINTEKAFSSSIYILEKTNLSPKIVYGQIFELVKMETCCENGIMFYSDTISHHSYNLMLNEIDHEHSTLEHPYFPDARCGGSFMSKETICEHIIFKVSSSYDRGYSPLYGWAPTELKWGNVSLIGSKLIAFSEDKRYKWVGNIGSEDNLYVCQLNNIRVDGFFSKDQGKLYFEPTHMKSLPMEIECVIQVCQRQLIHMYNGILFEISREDLFKLGQLRPCRDVHSTSYIKKEDFFQQELTYQKNLIRTSEFCNSPINVDGQEKLSRLIYLLKADYPKYPGVHNVIMVKNSNMYAHKRLFVGEIEERSKNNSDRKIWSLYTSEYTVINHIWYLQIKYSNGTELIIDLSKDEKGSNLIHSLILKDFDTVNYQIDMNEISYRPPKISYHRNFTIFGFNAYYVFIATAIAFFVVVVLIKIIVICKQLCCGQKRSVESRTSGQKSKKYIKGDKRDDSVFDLLGGANHMI